MEGEVGFGPWRETLLREGGNDRNVLIYHLVYMVASLMNMKVGVVLTSLRKEVERLILKGGVHFTIKSH